MNRFRVWAPSATTVDLVPAGGAPVPMTPAGGGWWEAEAAVVDYRFSVDGGPPRPDPRSMSQPDGPEGPSRVVDHSLFEWTDGGWVPPALGRAVIYELHIGTFSAAGTFDAAVDHLDDLVDLGVDAVEVMPIAEFGGDRGWGYDGVDLFAPHHRYGGPDGFKRFVDACHAKRLGVVLDVVYNHLGPAGNYLPEFGPYFNPAHQTDWGAAVNFDGPGCEEVRRFVVDNARMWVADYHVDGLRLDAVHAIVDDSEPSIHAELTAAVRAARPGAFVIAECGPNDPRVIDPGAFGYDAVWADDFHHAIHTVLTGERDGYYAPFGAPSQVVTALRRAWVTAACIAPPDRFVVCVQNHDQVGNRATGERLAMLVPAAQARAAAALAILSPFVVLLFQGEEWAASSPFLYFTDHRDPALGEAIRSGRRREFAAFGWAPEDVPDPQAAASHLRSVLDRSEQAGPVHAGMLAWYRSLLALRRTVPPGAAHAVTADGPEVRVRWGEIQLIANLGPEPIPVPDGATLMSHGDAAASLPAMGVAVWA